MNCLINKNKSREVHTEWSWSEVTDLKDLELVVVI